jgi:plasmid stabilization system protein ParE
VRRVEWSQDARNDLLGISLFISQANVRAAERVVRAIQATANGISVVPSLARARTKGLLERTVPRTPYVIVFVRIVIENSDEVFFIKRIIHTSRDWQPGKPPPK